MKKCPVCGMNVDKRSATTANYNGQTYLLATEACKEKFLANPGKYAETGSHSGHGQHRRGCC